MQSESSDVHDLLHARLDTLLDECNLVTVHASYGQTLDNMEELFLIKGRKFLQNTFQEKLQEHIDHTEAASEPLPCSDCKKTHSHEKKTKSRVSIHGSMTLQRYSLRS